MKKRTALLLIAVVCITLICVGCATENITQKEPTNDKPDIPVEDDNVPQTEKIKFESGILPTYVGAFYDDLTYENYPERKADIPDPLVTFVQTSEECNALIEPTFFEQIEEFGIDFFPATTQKMYATTQKYTDSFFADKQIIVITHFQTGVLGDYLVAKELVREETGRYCLVVELKQGGGGDADGLFIDTISVEVDRSLGITAENLTVELIKYY